MRTNRGDLPALPTGEQPVIERASAGSVVADTFGGRIHVEWDASATVTPLGQLGDSAQCAGQEPTFFRQ